MNGDVQGVVAGYEHRNVTVDAVPVTGTPKISSV